MLGPRMLQGTPGHENILADPSPIRVHTSRKPGDQPVNARRAPRLSLKAQTVRGLDAMALWNTVGPPTLFVTGRSTTTPTASGARATAR
jgi:hypothetical protein